MKHRQISTNFKLNPTKGIGGTVKRLFEGRAEDLGPLFRFLMKELSDAQQIFSRSNLFTLVSISNPVFGISAGYSTPSPAEFSPQRTTVLHFSLVPRPAKQLPAPTTYKHVGEFTAFWSDSPRQPIKYLSMSLPPDIDRTLPTDSVRDLVFLWGVIGAFTKSCVSNMSWYGQKFPENNADPEMLAARFRDKQVYQVVQDLPYNHWVYCKSIWQDASHFLLKEHFTKQFGLYYLTYLLDTDPNNLGEDANWYVNRDGRDTLHDFVLRGVLLLQSHVKSRVVPDRLSIEVMGLINAMLNASGKDTLPTSSDYMKPFLRKLITRVHGDPEFMQKFFRYFAMSSSVSRLLISNPEAFNQEILG